MIPLLASPSVCVIDDEEEDYGPILNALMSLGLGCVHVRGRSGDPLPPKPFEALRLVFTDLHLSGHIGKDAASHTAHVVKKVVAAESGPVLMVIWSKYADDPAGDPELPPDDQPTEADLFKAELLNSDPRFKTRLLFAQMPKPKLADRPARERWAQDLQVKIKTVIKESGASELLWIWESLARTASRDVSEELIQLTEKIDNDSLTTQEKLNHLLRLLSQQQGGPDNAPKTAARHLLTVFSQIGLDNLESAASATSLDSHGKWLSEKLDRKGANIPSSKLNTILLTSAVAPSVAPFVPGTLFDVTDIDAFSSATGYSVERLQQDCFSGDFAKSPKFEEFKTRTKPVLLEITPACDFHQGHRRSALLLAGLAFPEDLEKKANDKDACKTTPMIEDRFSTPIEDVGFVFCGRYRFTIGLDQEPPWVRPRLRLRDVLVTEFRNWHSGQAARVGYLWF